MITSIQKLGKQKGSSFVSPALGGVGQGRLNTNDNFPPKKIWAKPRGNFFGKSEMVVFVRKS